MREIGKEMFGLLYDKLYEHLDKTGGNIESVGIERGQTNEILSQLWNKGKAWETITLIIAYHYSRKDSILLRYSEISTLILHGSSFKEIQRLLGIKVDYSVLERCVIEKKEFTEEYNRLWSIFRDHKKIGNILDALGIQDKMLVCSSWKNKLIWETITAVIVLQRIKIFKVIEVETDRGVYRFKNSDPYAILETLQNAPLQT